jgi:high-affinity iron transporter
LRSVPRISLVGLFPTVQTVAAQILMIAALAIGFAFNRRRLA